MARVKGHLEKMLPYWFRDRPDCLDRPFADQLTVFYNVAFRWCKVQIDLLKPDSTGADATEVHKMLMVLAHFDPKESTRPVYRLAKTFGEHLLKTKLDVPCALLKDTVDVTLIDLPFTFKNRLGALHSSAFVEVRERRLSVLAADDLPPDGTWSGLYSLLEISLMDGFTLGEMLAAGEIKKGSQLSMDKDFLALIAKTLLYINSAEPDLKPEPVVPCLSKKPKKIRHHWEDHSPYEVINVGYSFHGRRYHIDGTTVAGHFRWQPCGPVKSEVRLIWIDEHERKYNQGVPL